MKVTGVTLTCPGTMLCCLMAASLLLCHTIPCYRRSVYIFPKSQHVQLESPLLDS